ncbi:hypothetical protein CDAR_472991 [Caerostris darwini]|uniref:Uncharacterized protein n=1 Tax=Caerostris darwini TaxID=1538125 RepID=A0AAV4V9M7_9ARAC|nr:hypothetical protein CDAR_472991 [Caerostris darwini]
MLWWSEQENIASWSSTCPWADPILRGLNIPSEEMAGLNGRRRLGSRVLQTDLYARDSRSMSLYSVSESCFYHNKVKWIRPCHHAFSANLHRTFCSLNQAAQSSPIAKAIHNVRSPPSVHPQAHSGRPRNNHIKIGPPSDTADRIKHIYASQPPGMGHLMPCSGGMDTRISRLGPVFVRPILRGGIFPRRRCPA